MDGDVLDLFETAPCGYLSTDPAGRIGRVNQTLADWLGRTKAELVGRRFQDLLNIAGKIYYETHFAPLLRMQGFFHEVALDLVAADGRRLPTLVNAVERRDAEGRVLFIRITVFNASDRRRYEAELLVARRQAEAAAAELRDLNLTLERRVEAEVAERLRAEEQLRQAQKMEALGQLTGGMAHDFNNLLTPIVAGLDLLLRRGLGGERERRMMEGALQSAERARVLVQRLLAFARRQPLQPGPVDLAGLVGGMAELIASTTGPRVALRLDLPPDLPPALADANQLEMALLNLAVNARDAMPDGGTLTISALAPPPEATSPTPGLRPGPYVRLSVRDTGEGMDEATLARAIEPFFSTKGPGRGTGLGLSMVHGLAAQLGGDLVIDSAPGLGTTVALWLPVCPVATGSLPVAEAVEQAERTSPQARGTVLLVDDEDLVRRSTADMLADLGYQVREARSAEEALRLVDSGLIADLVVTDHLMPGRSGADLARDLIARQPGLPVVIVSGSADIDRVAPDIPRLAKPFRAADLARRLASLGPGDGSAS